MESRTIDTVELTRQINQYPAGTRVSSDVRTVPRPTFRPDTRTNEMMRRMGLENQMRNELWLAWEAQWGELPVHRAEWSIIHLPEKIEIELFVKPIEKGTE